VDLMGLKNKMIIAKWFKQKKLILKIKNKLYKIKIKKKIIFKNKTKNHLIKNHNYQNMSNFNRNNKVIYQKEKLLNLYLIKSKKKVKL